MRAPSDLLTSNGVLRTRAEINRGCHITQVRDDNHLGL